MTNSAAGLERSGMASAPRFLHTTTHDEIRVMLGRAGEVRLAVAFWGKGALESLGIEARRSGTTQILYDLMSGACNPAVIKKLRELTRSGVEIRTRDNLHAKVYWTENGVVLGSSNASSNGLGFEGRGTTGNDEANAWIDDPAFVAAVRDWFDGLWADEARTRQIDDELLCAADALWKRRLAQDERGYVDTLLVRLKSEPDRFRTPKIRVMAYHPGYSQGRY